MATSRSERRPRLCAKTAPSRGPPFRRVLVANRGEIAVRIIRACHELGIEAVAVYSDADATAAHVRLADAAVRLGPAPPAESYLRIDAIVDAARRDRRRGGPSRLRLPRRAGGVRPRRRGRRARRSSARRRRRSTRSATSCTPGGVAAASACRSVPGTLEPAPVDRPDQVEAIVAEAERDRLPAAGQGRGRRRRTGDAPRRRRAEDLPAALAAGSREAALGVRRRIASTSSARSVPARHVEVQLLGDRDGPRRRPRRARLLAPAPPPEARRGGAGAGPDRRTERRDAPRAGGPGRRGGRPANAATGEFLLDPDGAFWFLEVNTRLQVEHGVTELVTGVDIVREQLWLAAGRPLSAGGRRGRRAGRDPVEPRDRGPPLGRGPGPGLRADARAASAAGSCRPARASASTRRSRPGTGSRPTTTT